MTATVSIGAKREKLRKIAKDLLAAADDESRQTVSLTINGDGNSGGWVDIEFSNDDMERDDVAADAVYVDIDTD